MSGVERQKVRVEVIRGGAGKVIDMWDNGSFQRTRQLA
jgi:hypothetical protein